MLKTLKKTIAFVILSFMGGFLAVLFLSWKGKGVVPKIDQAIAIANTYIVFTTFIFVAFTVLLTIVGYVLAQTFSANAKAQHTDVVESVKECISRDDEKATQVLASLLSSPQVQAVLSRAIKDKIGEEIQARRADAQMTNSTSAVDLQTLDGMLEDQNGSGVYRQHRANRPERPAAMSDGAAQDERYQPNRATGSTRHRNDRF